MFGMKWGVHVLIRVRIGATANDRGRHADNGNEFIVILLFNDGCYNTLPPSFGLLCSNGDAFGKGLVGGAIGEPVGAVLGTMCDVELTALSAAFMSVEECAFSIE